MNFKKIGIATVLGFVAMTLSSVLPLIFFYGPHFEALAEKFPDIVKSPPDAIPALIGGIVWIIIMVIIFEKMGTNSIKDGAITGAWLGASKWFFFNMQMISMIPSIFTVDYMIIDVPLTAFSYAVGGAAIGWALERFK